MATLKEAEEHLRIAKLILQIAKENNYHKVVSYLEDNVQKAQTVVESFGGFSPSKLLEGFFSILSPSSPRDSELPFTIPQTMSPLRDVTVVCYYP